MGATQQGAQSSQKLTEVERFRQVVVGAAVETAHAGLNRIARGEHEDRDLQPRIPELPADRETIDPRQTDVEDDRVEFGDGRVVHGLFAIRSDVDGVRFFAQALRQDLSGTWFILNEQNPHSAGPLTYGGRNDGKGPAAETG